MPRGGKRPGAGAPKGNLNGLKHGRYSRQFAEIGALIAVEPKVRDTLLNIGERTKMKQRTATEIAVDLLARTFVRERNRVRRAPVGDAAAQSNQPLPLNGSDPIKAITGLLAPGRVENLLAEALEAENELLSAELNQIPNTIPKTQSDADTKSH